MNVSYTFPATKGIQAEKPYYTATIPFRYLVRLFKADEDSVPANLRAQRALNASRAKGIADYILSNPTTFVLPAITASCDSSMTFQSLSDEHAVGLLNVPIDATLLINDGQHRRAALALVLEENPLLANESVSVTIFYDQGLKASQQMFADINGNACKPSGSLTALYDLRNPYAQWMLDVLNKRPSYKARIDFENANPPKKSANLWSLVCWHAFINLLTGVTEKNIGTIDLDAKTDEVLAFLDALDVIPLWSAMLKGDMPAEHVRNEYVIGNAVFLQALGLLGSYLRDPSQLAGLAQVDPTKGADQWDNRCVVQGKMRKTTLGVKSTTAKLLTLCGVPLTGEMADIDALCEGAR